jgi:hypothetical protein
MCLHPFLWLGVYKLIMDSFEVDENVENKPWVTNLDVLSVVIQSIIRNDVGYPLYWDDDVYGTKLFELNTALECEEGSNRYVPSPATLQFYLDDNIRFRISTEKIKILLNNRDKTNWEPEKYQRYFSVSLTLFDIVELMFRECTDDPTKNALYNDLISDGLFLQFMNKPVEADMEVEDTNPSDAVKHTYSGYEQFLKQTLPHVLSYVNNGCTRNSTKFDFPLEDPARYLENMALFGHTLSTLCSVESAKILAFQKDRKPYTSKLDEAFLDAFGGVVAKKAGSSPTYKHNPPAIVHTTPTDIFNAHIMEIENINQEKMTCKKKTKPHVPTSVLLKLFLGHVRSTRDKWFHNIRNMIKVSPLSLWNQGYGYLSNMVPPKNWNIFTELQFSSRLATENVNLYRSMLTVVCPNITTVLDIERTPAGVHSSPVLGGRSQQRTPGHYPTTPTGESIIDATGGLDINMNEFPFPEGRPEDDNHYTM